MNKNNKNAMLNELKNEALGISQQEYKRIVLNETGHTMQELKTIVKTGVNGEVLSVKVLEPRNIPAPSVSTIKGEIEPFDMTDAKQEHLDELIKLNPDIKLDDDAFCFKTFPDFKSDEVQTECLSNKELLEYYADKQAMSILKKGQDRGTCVHRQLEHYVNNGEEVGCMCHPQRYGHWTQFKHFKKWYKAFREKHNIVKHFTEVPNITKNYSLTGIYDVKLIGDDGTIYWGDWKTTSKNHHEMEIMQIILYRFLETNNFDVDFNKEKFFVYNPNAFPDGTNEENEDRDYKERIGLYYQFSEKEVKAGIKKAIKGIQKWNKRPIKERLEMSTQGWNDDEIADAHLNQYTDNDLLIELPSNWKDKLDNKFDTPNIDLHQVEFIVD